MSSNRPSRASPGVLLLGVLAAFGMGLPGACARDLPPPVCPTRTGDIVQAIDVFDGAPAELAYLAPDGQRNGASVFTLGPVYAEGRTVTIRCKYRSGASTDVEVTPRVEACTARRENSGNVAVSCR